VRLRHATITAAPAFDRRDLADRNPCNPRNPDHPAAPVRRARQQFADRC
jgi:hypothetical protein